MSQKQVVINIARDGTAVIDAQNFQGVGCADATRMIEVALSGGNSENVDDEKKPEFFNQLANANFNSV